MLGKHFHKVRLRSERLSELKLSFSILKVSLAKALVQEVPGNFESKGIGLQPAHLAYLIYTSGSSGRSKGVMIEHRSVAGRIETLRRFSPRAHAIASIAKTPNVDCNCSMMPPNNRLIMAVTHWIAQCHACNSELVVRF